MEQNKKGSALLIVIGFLSFMIVSAVAFSIYMRAERLPSSALRRTVTTRHLAKAALAEAISSIDDAVRGSPYPGVVDPDVIYNMDGDEKMPQNNWDGRIYMPPNELYRGSEEQNAAPAPETVSVLTLEGLGYLPPPLVNDARFLGRSSWTAAWQNFPYDAGRFAYVAVNVSDYFDVNRLYANKPRTSNADGRLSLAYLGDQNFQPYEEAQVEGKQPTPTWMDKASIDQFGGDLKTFDDKIHKPIGGNDRNAIQSGTPFVSMLDYQLGMKDGGSSFPSYFYQWINNSQTGRSFCEDPGTPVGRQPFVTDSCATNQTYEADIAYFKSPSGKQGQPFGTEITQKNKGLMDAISKVSSSPFFTALMTGPKTGTVNYKLVESAQGAEVMSLAALMWDYLDHDDMPCSLAWPSVERVPMVAAVSHDLKLKVPQLKASVSKQGKNEVTTWTFLGSDMLAQPSANVRVIYTYPYKYNDKRDGNFKAQVLMRVVIAPQTNDRKMLRMGSLGAALRPANRDSEWKANSTTLYPSGLFSATFVSEEKTIELPDKGEGPETAGGEIDFQLRLDQFISQAQELMSRTEVTGEDGTKVTTYNVKITPYNKDGQAAYPINKEMQEPELDKDNLTFTPYVCLWVRFTNDEQKTVDLVPAVYEDDKVYNDVDNSPKGSGVVLASKFMQTGASGPLLCFKDDNKGFKYINLTTAGAAAQEMDLFPKTYAALDPRFNYVPEDWIGTTGVEGAGLSYNWWYNQILTYLKKHSECDPDIYCAQSNMGFMQSLGEFGFLPRITDTSSGLAVMRDVNSLDGLVRDDFEKIANQACAWRTYEQCYQMYEYLNSCGIGRSTSREFLINPYSGDATVIMGALANTPCDYWCTGCAMDEENALKSQLGNDDSKTTVQIRDAKEGLKYAFSRESQLTDGQTLLVRETGRIAEYFKRAFRDSQKLKDGKSQVASRQVADAWKYIWDDLDWMPDGSLNYRLLFNNADNYTSLKNDGLGSPIELRSPLYGVDRKFLYSYWRDCFENQQQLFLIFVRAESNAIGGPGEGTPAQKGARAVALVWRNPIASTDGGRDGAKDDLQRTWIDERRPHQTRVLFYHQFD